MSAVLELGNQEQDFNLTVELTLHVCFNAFSF